MKRIFLMAILAASTLLLGLSAEALAHPSATQLCARPAAGHAHCDASLLVNKRHALIRPVVRSLKAAGRSAHTAAAVARQPQAGSPQWLQQAYDLTALSAGKGAGDTIAIVDPYDDPAIASDLATFRQTYGLPACTTAGGCLRVVNEQGAASPLPSLNSAWDTEETIDVEAASSVCPNCSLLLVEASSSGSADLLTAMQTAASLGANQISDSWSITATGSPFPTNLVTSSSASTATPAIFAASGDAGTDPLGEAEYPAGLPTVTAVGGTTLASTDSASDPRGYSESAWSDAGSGCAQGEPALSYQPASGCAGRAYSDVSADADPTSGLNIYEASAGGWAVAGGTSLATPIVAAFDAVTGVNAQTPQWAYADAAALNDPTGVSNGVCASSLQALLCTAGQGFDGPTGAGSVSGSVVAGAPDIAGPIFQTAGVGTDVESISQTSAQLAGGIYPNQQATSYAWQYGTTASYGHQTATETVPAGVQPSAVTASLSGLSADTTYHYRLTATNASGTSTGYDMTFTTGNAGTSTGSGFQISLVSTGSTHAGTNRKVASSKAKTASRGAATTAPKAERLHGLGSLRLLQLNLGAVR
jgi:hypothetical protein